MLILTRKKDEEIIIGDGEIVIKVIAITPTQVRISIKAPDEIAINRKEIYTKIKKEMEDASKS